MITGFDICSQAILIACFLSLADRPSKFIVLADSRKEAINMAWEHGEPEFQARSDKSTGQTQEIKEGALRVL